MEPDAPAVGVRGVDSLVSVPVVHRAPQPEPAPAARRDGEPLAFVEFYEAARDRVGRALAVTLGDAHLAAEAVDEAMARAFQRWDRVGGFDNPGGWVYRVGLNWATSIVRRRLRAPQPHAERGPTDVGPIPEPDVAAALAELPARQRAVVVCRFYLGLSEAETAQALATRPGTVKSRLHRALLHLRTRLAHLAPEENR
jgi:RNA polymerase sigma-70 factor (ECF subfamily)